MCLIKAYLWLRRKRKNPNYEDIILNNLIVKDDKKKNKDSSILYEQRGVFGKK